MAKLSGVNVSSIVSINTTNATSISYIASISTTNIPGWPSATGSVPTLLSTPIWLTTGSQYIDSPSALSVTATSGSWALTGGTGSYVYKWFVSGTLVQTEYSPFFETGKDGAPGIWVFLQPSLGGSVTSSYLFQPISLQITASNGYGSASTQIDAVVTDHLYNSYVSNSGITDSTTLNALQYLQKELRNEYAIDWLPDYYPLAGTTKDQQKWSMRQPNNYLDFSSGWTFNNSGSQATGTGSFATSSYISNLATGLLFYSATDTIVTNTASFDIGLYDTYNPNVNLIEIYTKVTASMGNPFYHMIFVSTYSAGAGSNVDIYRNNNPTSGWYGTRIVQGQTYTYSPIITGSILPDTRYVQDTQFGGTKLVLGGRHNPSQITGSFSSTKLYQFVALDAGVYLDPYYNVKGLKHIVQTYNSMLGR